MSKKNIKKTIKLSLELDTYIAKNPRILKSVPRGAEIIITSSRDKQFSRESLSMAHSQGGKFVEAHKTGKTWEIRSI